MKRYFAEFASSLLAGLFITIGATVYLAMRAASSDYLFTVLGSLMFALGLFGVIQFGLWLYTGKVGFTLDNRPSFLLDLALCLVGNEIGMVAFTSLIGRTRVGPGLAAVATQMVNAKMADSPLSIFLLSVMCGVMIYIAVKGHQVCPYACGKMTIVFLAISIFILCGFEHVIANAAYFTLAGVFNAKVLGYFALMAVGNGVGSVAVDGLLKLSRRPAA